MGSSLLYGSCIFSGGYWWWGWRGLYSCFHVTHAAVTDLDGALVKYTVQFVLFGAGAYLGNSGRVGARPNFPTKGCGRGEIFPDKGVAHTVARLEGMLVMRCMTDVFNSLKFYL